MTRKFKKMKKRKHCKTKTIKIRGGNVIGHGGYGCVFRPALKCKNKKSRQKHKISKLMKLKNVEHEYREIEKFNKILKNVPNYTKYYLLNDISFCSPSKLTEKDLENFDEKCIPMTKNGITKENINNNLDKVGILNIPDGGITVSEYIMKLSKTIQSINSALILLLLGGVLPMNKLNIYHNDIKESNVLIGSDGNCRLIDWGISVITDGKIVPHHMKDRPFQYNSPFSVILWNDMFEKMYENFLKKFESSNTKEMTFYDVKEFIIDFIGKWEEVRGQGHIDVILSIISLVNENESVYDGKQVIINYLSMIVFEYSKNKKNIFEYFKNIYLKNSDIWGFVMMYSIVLEKMSQTEQKNCPIYSLIQFIIKKYLFYTPTKVIDINSLVEDLKKINKYR
jgi:hypothetical protein